MNSLILRFLQACDTRISSIRVKIIDWIKRNFLDNKVASMTKELQVQISFLNFDNVEIWTTPRTNNVQVTCLISSKLGEVTCFYHTHAASIHTNFLPCQLLMKRRCIELASSVCPVARPSMESEHRDLVEGCLQKKKNGFKKI